MDGGSVVNPKPKSSVLGEFSISIAAATILGVLGKLALLYYDDQAKKMDWFARPIDPRVFTNVLLCMFLIFFRGKMMHDDAPFFDKLANDSNAFKKDGWSKFLIKLGLLLGYLSWLLWAPAIYFLDDRLRFSTFLIESLLFSTIWLVLDIVTRVRGDWRRAFWVIPNLFYMALLLLLSHPHWETKAACLLMATQAIDWLVSDPFDPEVG